MPRSPYDLLIDPDKTTLACPGGVVLGFGPGPGLRHAIFWNRVGSLFSCWRPAVAVLTLFDAADLHTPVPLRTRRRRWEPNRCTAGYQAPGLRIDETREGLTDGLRCLLKLTSTASAPREWVLFFHGTAEQWPFFDYQAEKGEPQLSLSFDLQKHMLTLTQPHPHDGLPPLNSIQQVTLARPIHACGFLQSESELATLWAEHGALASVRLRLGQVGGRFPVGPDSVPVSGTGPAAAREADGHGDPSHPPDPPASADGPAFTHRHPVYYFATRLRLEPGQTQLVSLGSYFATDDAHAALPASHEGTTPDEWQSYLREDVPQLNCSDAELTRYWYYVWYVLRANRTAAGAHVTHPFTAPSKYLYWGPWIWDGYFHVLGEMWLKDPQVAKDSIRAVLDMQFPNGYLPVCSGSNYRMCFHDACDGFSPSDGSPGGYASYVESALTDYREAAHPYEARFRYITGIKATAGAGVSARPPDSLSDSGSEQVSVIEREGIAIATEDIQVVPFQSLVASGGWVADYSSLLLFVDMEDVSPLDPAIGNLVAAVKEAKRHQKRLLLVKLSRQLLEFVQSIKLHKYVEMYPSREAALEVLAAEDMKLAAATAAGPTTEMLHNEKTQTPLITVAAAMYCSLRGDSDFAREIFPKLWNYEEWLWRRRTDDKGRFILWHGDESGWDDATRHYPVPARPFDVQVHAFMHRQGLTALAVQIIEQAPTSEEAGLAVVALALLAERLKLTQSALQCYWDASDRWYYDLEVQGNGESVDVRRKQIAPSGLFALLVDLSPRTVEACLDALRHERVFATPFPIPTLARCDPDYRPHGWGWNGPAWLQVNYFTIIGLMQAGQYPAAFELWEKTRQLIIRDGKPCSFELYDPELGTGMGCPDYSWQAMINHLIIRYFAGVGHSSLHPALPPGLNWLRLSNLPATIRAIELRREHDRVSISVELAEPLLLPVQTRGLGAVSAVTANGQPMLALAEETWELPAGSAASVTWEIIITCR